MSIEVTVADRIVESRVPGEVTISVVVHFDDASETMQIQAAFPDRGQIDANRAEAIRAAQQLAQRFANLRPGYISAH